MKNIFIITVCISILLYGCKKEENVAKYLNDFIGFYCGENITSNSWSIHNTQITISNTDNSRIIIYNFANTGEDVEATLENDKITIPEQIYEKKIYSGGNLLDYYLTISGSGILDVSKYFLQIDYTLESDYPESIKHGVVEMYNSSKLDVFGTYIGENGSAVISEENNNLLLSITYEENGEIYGWENIIGVDDLCNISFSSQDIIEINSGATQKISVGGSKFGGKIDFWVRHDWDDNQGFSRYEFSAIKTE